MKFILNIILITFSGLAIGQQLPQFSQHMYNKQVLNPAVTGSEMFMVAQLTHRSQWVGFGNSPTTQLLGLHSSINNRNFGVGGYLFNDTYGPFSNLGVNGSYAYHTKLSRKTKLGFGLSGTVSHFSVNGSKIQLNNDADPLINLTTAETNLKYNASFGLLLHNEIYYIGVSALNLIQQKDPLYKSNGMLGGSLPSVYHFNAIGGIGISLDKTNTIYPSFLVKYIPNNPIQIDFNLRYILENAIEFGISYRTDDAIIGVVNLYIMDDLNLIYSYDFTTSNMSKANKGSHEITLAYNIYYDPIYKKQKKRYNLKKVN
ncbi:MAG: type IX secretion system membrane protein PorP/SprF [Flavobacteriales bacterium]|nr:type IX secretion system membrane protein PorP/SprF [Flavobacteriales bacterium]